VSTLFFDFGASANHEWTSIDTNFRCSGHQSCGKSGQRTRRYQSSRGEKQGTRELPREFLNYCFSFYRSNAMPTPVTAALAAGGESDAASVSL